MLPLRARVDLGAMAMKGFSAFPKPPGLEPHHQIVLCHIQDTWWECLSPGRRCSRCIPVDGAIIMMTNQSALSLNRCLSWNFWCQQFKIYTRICDVWCKYFFNKNLLKFYKQMEKTRICQNEQNGQPMEWKHTDSSEKKKFRAQWSVN